MSGLVRADKRRVLRPPDHLRGARECHQVMQSRREGVCPFLKGKKYVPETGLGCTPSRAKLMVALG